MPKEDSTHDDAEEAAGSGASSGPGASASKDARALQLALLAVFRKSCQEWRTAAESTGSMSPAPVAV